MSSLEEYNRLVLARFKLWKTDSFRKNLINWNPTNISDSFNKLHA